MVSMTEHPMTTYRKAHGLTLRAMGNIVGVSSVTIWQIEAGKHSPRMALVQKFVDRTWLKADDFLRKQEVAPNDKFISSAIPTRRARRATASPVGE